jgi:hypothetical protein
VNGPVTVTGADGIPTVVYPTGTAVGGPQITIGYPTGTPVSVNGPITVTGADGIPTIVYPTGTAVGGPQITIGPDGLSTVVYPTGTPETVDESAASRTIIGPDGKPTVICLTSGLGGLPAATLTDANGFPSLGFPTGTPFPLPATSISDIGVPPFVTPLPAAPNPCTAPITLPGGEVASCSVVNVIGPDGRPTPVIQATILQSDADAISAQPTGPSFPFPGPDGVPSLSAYGTLEDSRADAASATVTTLWPVGAPSAQATWTNIIPEATTTYTLRFPIATLTTVTVPRSTETVGVPLVSYDPGFPSLFRRVLRRQEPYVTSFSMFCLR